MNLKYLPGLNGLRFFAAFFVIISHANQSVFKLGIKNPVQDWQIFEKGAEAVNFFFTLSGFLITYLLIQEYHQNKSISLRHFYFRRILRIWPLYFIVLGIGFTFFEIIYPKLYGARFFSFPAWSGLLMFVLFLPNLMAKCYQVGLLNPLWSIGVEEQFYLFWAPFLKLIKGNFLKIIIPFIILSASFYFLIYTYTPETYYLKGFFKTLKFHNMAIGSLFSYILFYKGDQFVKSIFSRKIFQIIIISIILFHYLIGLNIYGPISDIFLSVLYGFLILSLASSSNRIINLEKKTLIYLGKISYGLYMYHMVVDYFLRLCFSKVGLYHIKSNLVLIVSYHLLLLGLTIAVASLSFSYVEKKFLSLKKY